MTFTRPGFWDLLKAEPRGSLPVVSRQVETRDGCIVETLMFDVGNGEHARGFLTRPVKLDGRAPALLYMHSHGGKYEIGEFETADGLEEIHQIRFAPLEEDSPSQIQQDGAEIFRR